MSYNVTVYRNTGFNIRNIPASPSVLNAIQDKVTVPAIEVMQERFLSSVRVSASWAQVKDADYCNVGGFYYFVNNVAMLATDVAELSLSTDGLTSIGGVSNVTVLDGQTERYSEVSAGEGDDPLLAPTNTMQIEGGWMLGSSTYDEFYESTLSPGATVQGEGRTFTDGATGESVVVPEAKGVGAALTRYDDVNGNSHYRGTAMYDANNAAVKDNIAGLRSLGLEGAIISHVEIPSGMVTKHTGSDGYNEDYASILEGTNATETNMPISSDIAPNAANSQHINVSHYAKVGLLSCSGSSVEFIPSEINLASGVRRITDPNPDGKPYYRFTSYKGDSSLGGFWRNAISGMKWKNVPLVFVEASGHAINTIKTNAELASRETKYQTDRIGNWVGATEKAMGSAMSLGMMSTGFGAGAGFGAAAMNGSAGIFMSGYNDMANRANYRMTNKQLITNYALEQTINVPTLSFPYESEPLRDLHGNGVYCYRYKYSSSDISRIDKLITRFGKKYTAALTASMLAVPSGKSFIYIQCSDVSVRGNSSPASNWINDLASEQLKGGVRIWNTLPSSTI